MQPKSVRNSNLLNEKEITTITQLIGKEKLQKRCMKIFISNIKTTFSGILLKENKNTLIFGKEFYLNKIFL
jgi:hypothetical protein